MDARDPTAGDLPNELGTSVAITPHPARGASGPGSVRSTELGAGDVVTGRTGDGAAVPAVRGPRIGMVAGAIVAERPGSPVHP
jgi:hypothetical protein